MPKIDFDALITMVLMLVGIIGIWLLVGNWVVEWFKNIAGKTRKGKRKKTSTLDMMFQLTSKNDTDASQKASRRTLLFLTVLLFVAASGCAIMFIGFDPINIVLCLIVALLPFAFRYTKMQKLRINGGYEGQDLVSELRTQYKACNNNFIYAIDAAVERMKKHPYSQRQLARLSMKLKTYGSEEELLEALDAFAFAYNTDWGRILTYAIYHNIYNGLDASRLLDDLMENFKRINTAVEKAKRYSRDTLVVLRFLIPATFIGLIVFGGGAFNMGPLDMIKRQLTDPLGFKMFMIIVIMYSGALVCSSILSKPKYDL
jgi:hypothetical protein